MITDHQVERREGRILLGIAVENAVLDILTDDAQLQACVELLDKPHIGMVTAQMGTFGGFTVATTLFSDDTVAILIDGPAFTQSRTQTAGIYVTKDELKRLLADVRQCK
jgi:hypothetical protein